MNSKKRILVKCMVAMSVLPFNTYATTGQTGLEACADALVSELSMSHGTSVSYQLDPANENFESRLQSRERFSLYATDLQSKKLVSRMECIVNSRGRVIRLTEVPLDAGKTGSQVSIVD